MKHIEFAGYVIGGDFGNAANHPQFDHTHSPPEGYAFRQVPREVTADPASVLQTPYVQEIRDRAKALGATDEAIESFLQSRNLAGNLALNIETDLVFVPSVPHCITGVPWVIEIEDVTSLFFPFLHNGKTATENAKASPCYPVLRALLETDHCRGVITHVMSTARMMPILFGDIVGDKTFYCRMGIHMPPVYTKKRHEGIHLSFTNSWHQNSASFYLRGGHFLLDAFKKLTEKFPEVHLNLRTELPPLPAEDEDFIKNHPNIHHYGAFVTDKGISDLLMRTDLFMIPAARLHVISTIAPMAYGVPVVCTDGWGFSEYVDDADSGFILPGTHGVASWEDMDVGMLREDYEPMYHCPNLRNKMANAIDDVVSRFIAAGPLARSRLSERTRDIAEVRYNLTRWNEDLGKVFDRVIA